MPTLMAGGMFKNGSLAGVERGREAAEWLHLPVALGEACARLAFFFVDVRDQRRVNSVLISKIGNKLTRCSLFRYTNIRQTY